MDTATGADFYTIRAEPDRNFLRICFATKFWDLTVVDRFVGDIFAAALGLPDPEQVRSLVDLRNAILQSAEVIAKLQHVMANHTVGPIALVAENALARMQTKRLQVRDGIRLFPTIEAAEAWLFAGQAERPAAAAVAAR